MQWWHVVSQNKIDMPVVIIRQNFRRKSQFFVPFAAEISAAEATCIENKARMCKRGPKLTVVCLIPNQSNHATTFGRKFRM